MGSGVASVSSPISIMSLHDLHIQNIRNLADVRFKPCPRINLIYGENGSGKTSVLEALHFLASSRSFRTHQFRHLLRQGESQALVFARLHSEVSTQPAPLGVERDLHGQVRARFDGHGLDPAELAQLLPLQVIHPGTFELLDGSPGIRRQFIDWGGFHADSQFIHVWRSFRRALKQRNSLLKCGKIDRFQMQVWDREFVQHGELLTQLRLDYMRQLQPEFQRILSALLSGYEVEMRFASGWDSKRSLADVVEANATRDRQQGFTLAGPQRADMRFRLLGQNAADVLSRGQKKLLVSALKLAQGALYQKSHQRACIYLIDDLPSELDETHSRLFCHFLRESSDQCFITCVDPDTMTHIWAPDTELALFEAEAGRLSHRLR